MALMNDVYSYIENNYQTNEPIFLSELNIPGMKAVSVRQQMKKLTESGQLKRFDTEYTIFLRSQCFVQVQVCQWMKLLEESTWQTGETVVVMLEGFFLQTSSGPDDASSRSIWST